MAQSEKNKRISPLSHEEFNKTISQDASVSLDNSSFSLVPGNESDQRVTVWLALRILLELNALRSHLKPREEKQTRSVSASRSVQQACAQQAVCGERDLFSFLSEKLLDKI